jgi:hypothetical protein
VCEHSPHGSWKPVKPDDPAFDRKRLEGSWEGNWKGRSPVFPAPYADRVTAFKCIVSVAFAKRNALAVGPLFAGARAELDIGARRLEVLAAFRALPRRPTRLGTALSSNGRLIE